MSRLVLAVPACVLSTLFLSGCSNMTSTATPVPSLGATLRGTVHGGQQPIVGAHIYLIAANTAAYGGASVSLLSSAGNTASDGTNYYVTTDTNGSFSITGDYSCASGRQVYLYAVGGSSDGNPLHTNSAIGLLAVLGNCTGGANAFLAAIPHVMINEVSTVAAAYALSGFATDPTHVADDETDTGNLTPAQAQAGMANAFAATQNLAPIATGSALATTPGGNGTVPQGEINTLANILAACVNTTSSSSTSCTTLLSTATSDGTSNGTAPTDTAAAAINIAHHPAANISTLFALVPAIAPFTPSLGSAPNDWTLAINFTGGGLNAPRNLAVDAAGNIWVPAYGGSVLAEFSPLGVPANSTGFTGGGLNSPASVAIDITGNVWVANYGAADLSKFSSSGSPISPSGGYTGGGLGVAYGIAVGPATNVWVSSPLANTISKFSSTGAPLSTSSGFTGSPMDYPSAIALSPTGQVWIANYDDSTLMVLNTTGAVVSPSSGYFGGGMADTLATTFDSHGNLFTATNYGAQIAEFNSSGTPVTTSSGYTGGGLSANRSIAVDGLNNVWVASDNNTVSEFSNTGTPLSPSTGFQGGSISAPWGLAIDGSGNLWIADTDSNALTEFVGAAAPVVTPSVFATKYSKFGTRP